MLKLLKSKSGEGYVDIIVIVLCIMLFVALAVRVFPVFIEKNQLDTFAAELVREAEIAGRVGSETTAVPRPRTRQRPISLERTQYGGNNLPLYLP